MRSFVYMDLHTVVSKQGGRTEHVRYVGDETKEWKCSTGQPEDKKTTKNT